MIAADLQTAESPVTVGIFFQRQAELLFVEVGPVDWSHVIFGISPLPDEKVAHTHLSAGTDDQIGVRLAAGVKVCGQHILGDGLGWSALGDDAADGFYDLGASAVVEGHVEDEPVVVAGGLVGPAGLFGGVGVWF